MGYSYWNGAEAAHRRVMMKATGSSDEDILRNHTSEYRFLYGRFSGNTSETGDRGCEKENLDSGGIPVEFGIPATCGNVANGADEMKYEQVGRDIVAMSIEFVSRIHNFDAICCVKLRS